MWVGRTRKTKRSATWCVTRLLWVHAVVDDVDQELHHGLGWHVIPWRPVRHKQAAIFEDHAWAWRQARPLARGQAARVVRVEPALHAPARHDKSEPCHQGRAGNAVTRCG